MPRPDLQARRTLRLQVVDVGPRTQYDISDDGRTVWVNGKRGPVARFCPVSGEVTKGKKFLGGVHKGVVPTRDDWTKFVRLVVQHTRIPETIVESHRPMYIPEAS